MPEGGILCIFWNQLVYINKNEACGVQSYEYHHAPRVSYTSLHCNSRVVQLLALQLACRTACIATRASYSFWHCNSRVVQLLALQLVCRTAPCVATRVSYSSSHCNSVIYPLPLQPGLIHVADAAIVNYFRLVFVVSPPPKSQEG